ncbi:hypothetical protein [Alkalimarinus alittae]|uniref:Glycosyltransferase RgtA/B/C/D-like domain-containing protein n=1 Tax=Alkalimarinus alittae TaxID=2961619 RepID=A0ABY6N1L5_9ALTE|nr:hypothetical protein [Alkalimarinus alittae]UZE95897.1 hypothetical protein NKI27_17900 [Alkalimarinus alittae]
MIFIYTLLLTLVSVTLYHWCQFPALPANDDALFLSRGISHFSVVEFSPHFPGYAGLVLLVKSLSWLFSSDYQALHIVVLMLTSMIPVVVFLILNTLQVGRYIPLAVAAILYFQPLLISVALSGLSDGPGLLSWLLVLLFLLRAQPVLSGFLSGVMLTIRPSYLLLVLPLIGFLLRQHRHQTKLIIMAISVPLLLSAIYMYSKDGLALFEEAYRFIRGHFLVWGNTSLNETTRVSWWYVVSDYIGGEWQLVCLTVILLLGCCVVWVKHRAAQGLIVSFVFILLWTLLFQNPDNLRHFLPVMVLAVMIISLMLSSIETLYVRLTAALASMVVAFSLLQAHQLPFTPPAIQQALSWLETQSSEGRYEGVIITNEGVELAKEYQTKRRVADAWYQQQAAWLWSGGAWRMSYNPVQRYGEAVAVFPRRLAGEHATYVYRLITPDAKQ